MNRTASILSLLVALAACQPGAHDVPTIHTRVVETGPLHIEGIEHSMEGEFQRVPLDTEGIGWVTGFRTDVVDATTGAPLGDEFFCHSQLQLDTGARLMVAATGIREVTLPEGFGIPLQQILGDLDESWRGVSLMGMVLNNFDADLSADVKLRFSLDYVSPDDPNAAAVKRLYRASVTILPDHPSVEVFEGDPPQRVSTPRAAHGKTGHWMVPPGRQILRERYRGLIGAETQVHFGVVHLHNYGRAVRLTDLTTGEVLWHVEAAYEPDRPQIRTIPVYSSVEGFTMFPDHEYELATVYDNTSDVAVDAMATMYLYHHPADDRTLTYPPDPHMAAADTAAGAMAHQHH